MTDREADILYSTKDLFSLGALYPSDFLAPGEEPRCEPVELKLVLDGDGFVKLEQTAPKEAMWGERYWYRSSISKTMRGQLEDVVEDVLKTYRLGKDLLWIDIAGNDGYMLSQVPDYITKINIDPAGDSFKKEAENHCDLVIQDYFNAKVFKESKYGDRKASIISCVSMFYDLSNPREFLDDVYEILEDDGLFILQLSYSPLMIEQLEFTNLCHEHRYYYTFKSIEHLLHQQGFRVMDVSLNNTNAGSFRIFCMKDVGNPTKFGSPTHRDVCNFRIASLWNHETTLNLDTPRVWREFFKRINTLKEHTMSFIKAEKAKGKTIMGYGACHDTQTKVVTEDGIKSIDEVTVEDKVYTLNVDTNEMELSKIEEIMKYPYDGDMVHFKGKRIDQLVTPNHQVLYYTDHISKLRFENAETIRSKSIFYLPKSTWTGIDEEEIDIRKFTSQEDYNYHIRRVPDSYKTIDFLYLLGLFIGDGYISDVGTGFSINLCIPKKDKARQKLIDVLNRMGLLSREYDNEIHIASKALCTIFEECQRGALNKRIPKWALQYSNKYLEYLLDGLVDSDGWYEPYGRRRKFCSSSYLLVKDVCELALKLGLFPSINTRRIKNFPKIKGRVITASQAYIVNLCTNPLSVRNNKEEQNSSKINYKGSVWCLSVNNKNFLVERNGKLSFSGNSTKFNTLLQYFGLNQELVAAIADRNPDKYGLRTVGSNIPIISEEEMRKLQPDYLLIGPFQFMEEFMEREKEYLQKGGNMIVCMPKFEIVTK